MKKLDPKKQRNHNLAAPLSSPENDNANNNNSNASNERARIQELVERISFTRHEINNLLTGILGQTQLLLLREDFDDATARQRVLTIEELVKRIKHTVADLNDIV